MTIFAEPVNPPLDSESVRALADTGLQFHLLDTTPTGGDSAADQAARAEALRRWLLAEARGFHDPEPSDERLAGQVAEIEHDRISAVYDDTGADAATPVATVRSWLMGLTVPGGGTLPAWAISSVTVSPTHRRRGVARALLGSELRTAAAAGLAMAMLTVSEATIYGRFGFGPAVHRAHYRIDTTRTRWIGPTSDGRVQFVTPESLLVDGRDLFDRARAQSPGEVDRRTDVWSSYLGLNPRHPGATSRDHRAVRYDDADGVPQGFAVYTVAITGNSFPARLTLVDLVAATDDATAALWRFLLEMDLVTEIDAPGRNVSEPLAWLVTDRRAVTKIDESDHLWLRILDVPAALEARRYAAADTLVFDVTDDLGFAHGRFELSVRADGTAEARRLPAASPAADPGTPQAAHLALTVADLGALYLGGASARDLVRAGRARQLTADAAGRVDAALRTPTPPFLSTGF
ncbi:MAG: GNAT family N-acetyltransferase [Cryobacterium sp.]